MDRCGQERASCGLAVANREWFLSQERGEQASTHRCCAGGGDQVNGRLMSCRGIFVSRDQFLRPVPAAFRAVEVGELEPGRPRFNGFNERSPTQRIERKTLDVAATALVDNRHGTFFL
jgi:hypothetical protein